MSQEGEIVARLKLDGSDYKAGIEEAKAEAESLKSVDPRITVKADTATAIAGLTAVSASADKVAAAEERLRLATQASERATGSALLAQMRLADVQNKRGRTAYQVAAAEEALRVATERSDNAALKAIAAEDQLAAAHRDAAKAALEQGAAADVAGQKTRAAAAGPAPLMAILVGSIAAVSPGIVAVGAAAIGLAADLGAVAGTGLLAFKGIQTGINASLPLFSSLNDAMDTLGGDLTSLEMTAAGGILTGLSSALRTVEGDMVPLTDVVSILSSQLGGLLASSAAFAVHSLTGLAPVFIASGTALQGFLQGLDGFTQSNGFTDFVNYTVARLPDVMHLIDATLGALGSLFAGLAPGGQAALFLVSSLLNLVGALGPVLGSLMPLFTGVADAVGGVALGVTALLNVLGPLAPLAIAAGAAFFTWGSLGPLLATIAGALQTAGTAVFAFGDAAGVAAPLVRGLGVAIDTLAGPVGIAIAAVVLLGSAFLAASQDSTTLAASTEALTSAIQQDSGVVGENVKTLTAHQLVSDGAAAAGARLGLSLKTITSAATGNTAAMKQVNDVVQAHGPLVENATQRHSRFHAALSQSTNDARLVSAAVAQQNAALKAATDQYNKIAVATGNAKVSQQQMAAAAASYHMPVAEYAAAAAAADKQASAAQAAGNAMRVEGNWAGILKTQLDLLNGVAISAAQAQNSFDSSIANMAQHIDKTGKQVKRADDLLTGMSAAAVANRGDLIGATTAAQQAGEAYLNMGRSGDETRAKLLSMRQEIINHAASLGMDRGEVTKFVDEMFKIPTHIESKVDVATGAATSAIASTKAAAQNFARAQYLAQLKANPQPANANSADAARKAHAYAAGDYQAVLRANPGPAMSAIQAVRSQLQNLSGTTASVYINAIQTGSTASNAAQIARNAGFADGGTIPGLASGGPGLFSGSVSGPGNASNDMAGVYRLANGEFVTSNMRGQADAFRGVLEAINSQKVKTPAQLGQMLGGGRPQVTQITRNLEPHITIQYPATQDPVSAAREAAQYIQAYSAI